jgi:hypothetical protein
LNGELLIVHRLKRILILQLSDEQLQKIVLGDGLLRERLPGCRLSRYRTDALYGQGKLLSTDYQIVAAT